MLASSLAEISALASHQKSAKSSLAISALIDKAPSAVAKLKAQGGLVSALTMGEISAITARYFKSPIKTGPKSSFVKQLEDLITAQPTALAAAPAAPVATAAPAVTAAPAPAAAAAAAAPVAAAAAALRDSRVLRHLRDEESDDSAANDDNEDDG